MHADTFKFMFAGMFVRTYIESDICTRESSFRRIRIWSLADSHARQGIHAFNLMSIGIAV